MATSRVGLRRGLPIAYVSEHDGGSVNVAVVNAVAGEALTGRSRSHNPSPKGNGMRLLRVFHHARGGDFTRLQPDLTAFSLPILRVALRLAGRELDPPAIPVIVQAIGGETMVWALEASVATLVRPTRWIDGPPALAELSTDSGSYLAPVFTTEQALAACWRLCPPPTARTSRTVTGAADLLRTVFLELRQLVSEPMDPVTVAHLLASLTVCAELLPTVLDGVADAIRLIAADPDMSATPLPGVHNPYGDPSACAACLGAELHLGKISARVEDLAELLAGAHQYMFRVHPGGPPPPLQPTAGAPPEA
jgi:hypothetical protein